MRVRIGFVICLLLALAEAGCGGGDGSDELATAGGTASPTTSAKAGDTDEAEAALKYVHCMRENGIPNMADPKVNSEGEVQLDLNADGVDPATAKAAEEKCKKLLPNGGEPRKIDPELQDRLRQYSKCMRDNGLPDFPDPTDQGLQVNGNQFPQDDPKVKAATEKCSKLLPQRPGDTPATNQVTQG